MAFEVFLMIIFGLVECFKRFYLGHYRRIPNFGFGDFFNHPLSDCLLLIVMIKYDRSILSADILTLAVQCGWIVRREEDFQEFLKRNYLGVKSNLYDFGMTCCPSGHLLISWICYCAARITRFNFFDTSQFIENSFCAPKATSTKSCHFLLLRKNFFRLLLNHGFLVRVESNKAIFHSLVGRFQLMVKGSIVSSNSVNRMSQGRKIASTYESASAASGCLI